MHAFWEDTNIQAQESLLLRKLQTDLGLSITLGEKQSQEVKIMIFSTKESVRV